MKIFLFALVLATYPVADAQDMPGMNMTAPKPAAPAPPSNPKAKAAASSEQQSIKQQAGQESVKPSQASDASSMTRPIDQLQEPEAVGFQTGSDLPAPELLGSVVSLAPMTLDAFLTLADHGNPTIMEAQRNADRSNQQARQASLPPDPILGYSGDHIRGGSYHGGEEGAFFSQEFVIGHKLALRRDIFRAQGNSNDRAVEVQQARVHDDISRAFFDALTAQQLVLLQDRLLKVALDAQTNAHELERVGQADASDVLNAEIGSEQAKVEFVNAQRGFLTSFTQLATLAGQLSLAPHPLTGSLLAPPEVDAENLVRIDMQESPAVKQAQAGVVVAEARLKSARRESIPNLNVKAGEWYSGEELGATGAKAGFESFVEAGVQVPLWNRNQGNAEASRAELDHARQEVLRVQLLTRHRAEPFAQQYQTAHFTVQRYRTEILPRARRSYELEVMKYQQMALAYPAVLTAQRLLYTLEVTYAYALNEEWQSAIALQNFALMNGLDEPADVGDDSTTINLPTASN